MKKSLQNLQKNYKIFIIIAAIFLAGFGMEEMMMNIKWTDINDLHSWELDAIDLNMNLRWTIDMINSETPPTADELYGMNLTCHSLLDNSTDYSHYLLNFDGNRQMCTDITGYYNSIN